MWDWSSWWISFRNCSGVISTRDISFTILFRSRSSASGIRADNLAGAGDAGSADRLCSGSSRVCPASLVTVAAGIAASSLAGLNRMGIELVGEVRGGLPSFASPGRITVPALVACWDGDSADELCRDCSRREGVPKRGRTAAGGEQGTLGTGLDEFYWRSLPKYAFGRRHIADSGQSQRGRPKPDRGIGGRGRGRGSAAFPCALDSPDAPGNAGYSSCRVVRRHDPSRSSA